MSARTPIYLDYAATTPVDPAVALEIARCLSAADAQGNASSVTHAAGRAAAALIAGARTQVAALIGAECEEIVFTSGATESNNLALLGVARANADRGRHLVTSRIEHKAVLDPARQLEKEGFHVSYLTPDACGCIGPERVRTALRADTVVVSIMHVNNEIGTIEDIAAIGAICRERAIPFHCDAAQSAGRIALDVRGLPVDLLSLTAHKMYGPKGIGALYVSSAARGLIKPILFGGGQERGLRPGTPATHQIVGFGAAAARAAADLASERERLAALRERLWAGLEPLGGVHLNGAGAERAPHILNVSFEGVDGEALVAGLQGLAVSTGAACSSASGEPSYVLRALGRSTRLAESSLRFSLGRFTTAEEVDRAVREVHREVLRLRAVSPDATIGVPRVEGSELDSSANGPMVIADGTAAELAGGKIAALFRRLPAAGTFGDRDGTVLRGEAGGPQDEVWVSFHLLVQDDTVKDARFRARGCPHTLAIAAWLAERLRGRRREEALPAGPRAWAEELGVPAEKLGRLLVIEDALRAALARWP
ncbi:MAG TPA: aminotransferase class V-fold PLP-dependent enzyme [Steroidobacteraceae bacterium]|nr:aminotransferase class V-fold PLP-dependent enzyme [Steroidobacteraceae bacterium]